VLESEKEIKDTLKSEAEVAALMGAVN